MANRAKKTKLDSETCNINDDCTLGLYQLCIIRNQCVCCKGIEFEAAFYNKTWGFWNLVP